MSELASLRNLALRGIQFRPADVVAVTSAPAPKSVPDLTQAALTTGNAQAIESIGDTVAGLPTKINTGIATGRQQGREKYLADLYADTNAKAQGGDPYAQAALADFDFTSQGVSYRPVYGALRDVELEGKQAAVDASKANTRYLNTRADIAANPVKSSNPAYDANKAIWDAAHPNELPAPGAGGLDDLGLPPITPLAGDPLPIPGALSGAGTSSAPVATTPVAGALSNPDFIGPTQPEAMRIDPAGAALAKAPAEIAKAPILGANGGTLTRLPGGEFVETFPDGSTMMAPPNSKTGAPVVVKSAAHTNPDAKSEAQELAILMKKGIPYETAKTMTPEERGVVLSETKDTIPAKLKTEAVQMGVWKDGMSLEDVSGALEKKSIEDGVIPPHLIPAAQSMARLVVNHPGLKHIPTIREAKEAVDAGLENQDTGGFGDMAIIEGFQRMINPGAVVRSQTMDQMLKGAGLGQYLDLGFVMDHFKEGDKFGPDTRARLKKLSEDIYARQMKNAGPQMAGLKKVAKAYGISNPDAFIDNVMVMAPVLGTGQADTNPGAFVAPPPAPSGMMNIQTSDGAFHVIPNTPEAIRAAKAKDPSLKTLQ